MYTELESVISYKHGIWLCYSLGKFTYQVNVVLHLFIIKLMCLLWVLLLYLLTIFITGNNLVYPGDERDITKHLNIPAIRFLRMVHATVIKLPTYTYMYTYVHVHIYYRLADYMSTQLSLLMRVITLLSHDNAEASGIKLILWVYRKLI